jgi:integrase
MILNTKNVSRLHLPSGKTDHIQWDEALPGFGFRLRAGSGGKVLRSWIAQYRHAGATRRVLLGAAAVLNAEQARIAAKKALASATLGEDPQAKRTARRSKDRLTVRSVIDEYLAAKEALVRASTMKGVRRFLTGPYFKGLHGMPIDAVTRKDVAACLAQIARTRSVVISGRGRACLHAFAVWCMQMGYIEHNPVVGTLKPKASDPRERVLSEAELAAVWRACEDDDHGRIVRLMILTGCRRQEIGGMRWSEFWFHPAGDMWTLPKERAKNARALTLPLPAMAWDIINAVPRMATRDQLFGLRCDDGFSAWWLGKQALNQRLSRSDTVAPFILHDVRRSVATGMGDIGIQPHIIEEILNHKSGAKRGVAGIYNRSTYEREVKAALALWADHVRALAEGGKTQNAAA